MRAVRVVDSDPRWPGRYRAERARLRRALAPLATAIHHIGSTAVPGLPAKPVIDILVEVRDVGEVDARAPVLAALGYEARGEFGIPGRRFFLKNDAAGVRTHHVHVFKAGAADVERHLALRDFLVARPGWRARYGALKRRLARAHAADIEGYVRGKGPFIRELEARALRWRAGMKGGGP